MRITMISKGGQISVPAEIRHRWGTRRVVVEDQGNALLIRPIPADPIGAAIGSLAGRRPTSDELRSILRDEGSAVDQQRDAADDRP
jgi:bifunctional DNA-binding transcriptional regulator/antitoxin component of YhaV-PrlF toxin-antitoxin module